MKLASDQPGYFEFVHGSDVSGGTYMYFNCPCGCGHTSAVSVCGPQDKPITWHPQWQWDGDEAKPTLQPSLKSTGLPCHFHAFLTKGEWTNIQPDGKPAAANVYKAI